MISFVISSSGRQNGEMAHRSEHLVPRYDEADKNIFIVLICIFTVLLYQVVTRWRDNIAKIKNWSITLFVLYEGMTKYSFCMYQYL